MEFPFNWFPQRVGTLAACGYAGDRGVLFPFNWFPQRVGTDFVQPYQEQRKYGFHLIGFPSEWGLKRAASGGGWGTVSI